MNWGRVIEESCQNVDPGPDPRCSDPAFALANPGVCPVAPTLILKPAVGLMCVLGSIQLKAFFTKDGVETDVTEDCIFTSSDLTIAVIGVVSGNATGMAEGAVTFSATYQGLKAFAEMRVLGGDCCADETVALAVCVDNSRSMSLAFGGAYSTRLAFAKAAAARLIGEVNEQKDVVGLLKFNDASTDVLASPTSDKAAVQAFVPGISQTQQKTSFYECISQARAEFDALGDVSRKIIILISDFEDSTPSYSDANNPIAALDDFKSTGGIVICLGCRSSGRGFALASRLATGGFFINAYSSNAAAALDYVSGLKGYVCAGNCVPEGDAYAATGQLNYRDFLYWDLTDGFVDLQGNGFFDYLPGNGLYVDLVSGDNPSGAANPKLTLKTALSLSSGKEYRFTFRLAGNQVTDNSPSSVRIRVFSERNEYLNTVVSINDYTQGFKDYAYTLEMTQDDDVKIEIQQTDNAGLPDPTAGDRAGMLLSSVKVEDVTDATTEFLDDFSGENLQYVPPRCGTGTTYTPYGYISSYAGCYGVGCLDEPPPSQLQDPSPLPDIEAGYTAPQTYSSTKSKCVTCPSGFTNLSADGAAYSLVSNELDGGTVTTVFHLTGSAIVPEYYQIGGYSGWYPKAWTFEGSNNGTSWTVLDTQENHTFYDGQVKKMLLTGVTTAYAYYRFVITEFSGTPDLVQPPLSGSNLVFPAVDESVCSEATAESEISQQDADSKALASAQETATAQLNCIAKYTSTQQYVATCPNGTFGASVTKSATRVSLVSQEEADALALAAAREAALAALDCTGSNNTQRLDILDGDNPPTKASPYPGVKYVSGLGTSITKVTLTLKRWNHGNYADCAFLLVSPSGTAVQVIGNVMDAAFDTIERNVTLDDDAALSVPQNSRPAGVDHTYKPTIYVGQLTFPSPAPAGPYGTTMSTFNGEDPNGSWALYAADDTPLDSGYLLQGWDLTIETA